jgi:hypothetical protein
LLLKYVIVLLLTNLLFHCFCWDWINQKNRLIWIVDSFRFKISILNPESLLFACCLAFRKIFCLTVASPSCPLRLLFGLLLVYDRSFLIFKLILQSNQLFFRFRVIYYIVVRSSWKNLLGLILKILKPKLLIRITKSGAPTNNSSPFRRVLLKKSKLNILRNMKTIIITRFLRIQLIKFSSAGTEPPNRQKKIKKTKKMLTTQTKEYVMY